MIIQRWPIILCGLFAWISTLSRDCKAASDLPSAGAQASADRFLVQPYLQLGDVPTGVVTEDLRVLWHASESDADWQVEYRPSAEGAWRRADAPGARQGAGPEGAPHWGYRAILQGLLPGDEFAYRVLRGGQVLFSAGGRAPKSARQPYRFVVFGDCAAGTDGQKAVANQAYRARPDFVLIAGDIVYARGRISEYRE